MTKDALPRVAISNHRLLAFDGAHVTFSHKDYAHGDARRTMTLTTMEFLRRFVQHHPAARLRAYPPVRIPREYLPGRPRGACPHCPRHPLAVGAGHRHDRASDHGHASPRDVDVSAVRRRHDRRADPLGALPRDRHLEFR